jgi:hypothetical protein
MKSLYAEMWQIKHHLSLWSRLGLSLGPSIAHSSGHHMRRLLLAGMLLVVVIGSAEAAAIYSWVDGNGVQHFSAMPPPNRDDYQIVSIDGTTSLLRRVEQEAVPAEQEAEPEEATTITAPDTTVTVIDPEVVARNCERARQNLFLIESRRRIVITEDNGEQRRLDDNERAALMQKSQDYIDENCQN